MRAHSVVAPLTLALSQTLLISCSSSSGDGGNTGQHGTEQQQTLQPGAGDAGAGSESSSSSSTTTAPPTNTQAQEPDQALIITADDSNTMENAPSQECARDVYAGDPVDVNIYVLMDVSGSMRAPLNVDDQAGLEGDTLWDAVSGATKEFLTAKDSDGLNVALSLFPIRIDPTVCQEGDTCTYEQGTPDEFQTPCIVGVCATALLAGGVISPCQQNSNCTQGDACALTGKCEQEPTRFCAFDSHCRDGDTCVPDTGMPQAQGMCLAIPSCDVTEYETPLLPKATLPDAASTFVDALNATMPDGMGNTPTHVALAGAYTQVEDWIAAEPDSSSVVVLVTDGLPYGCDTPSNTNDLCSDGSSCAQSLDLMSAAADRGIQTYVVGVYSQGDVQTSQIYADMATAGNTGDPFLVSVDMSASENLLNALAAIRGEVVPCEFGLPEPTSGALDLDQVNVEIGSPDPEPRVLDVADCGEDGVGWYYTETNGEVSGIELCPQSCEQAKVNSQVDIVLGCPQVLKMVK